MSFSARFARVALRRSHGETVQIKLMQTISMASRIKVYMILNLLVEYTGAFHLTGHRGKGNFLVSEVSTKATGVFGQACRPLKYNSE